MEPIPIRYAELRRTAAQVQTFLAARLEWQGAYDLRLRLEDDFGLAGLDTESLLEEFAEQFRVDLSGFDFNGYISPEPGADATWLLPLVLLLLYLPLWAGAWAAKLLLAALCFPFSRSKARALGQLRLGVPDFIIAAPPATPKVLRIGDLVASAAVGRFVKRETVRFALRR